ncbi:MAG: hypothetical protein GC191_06435 [Azospirillum sp.]|nr:hypothetical protein [Azospirillum sp.]
MIVAGNGRVAPMGSLDSVAAIASSPFGFSGFSSRLNPDRAAVPTGQGEALVVAAQGQARQTAVGAASIRASSRASSAAASSSNQADRSPAAGASTNDASTADSEKLKSADRAARQRAQAQLAAAGAFGGQVVYQYQRGADGTSYVVGASVTFDVTPVPNDPAATIRKMQTIRAAALASGQPTLQDLQAVQAADAAIAAAQAALSKAASATRSSPNSSAAVAGGPGKSPTEARLAPAATLFAAQQLGQAGSAVAGGIQANRNGNPSAEAA